MKHKEAFCLMTYRLRSPDPLSPIQPEDPANPDAPETLVVWNSRDGVTPFCLFRDGREYQHEMREVRCIRAWAWALQPGDLVWESVTLEQAREWALSEKAQAAYADAELPWHKNYPTFAHFAVDQLIRFYGQGGEPSLQAVDQAWIDAYRNAEPIVAGGPGLPYWMRSGRHG